jgi:hypothetical protein
VSGQPDRGLQLLHTGAERHNTHLPLTVVGVRLLNHYQTSAHSTTRIYRGPRRGPCTKPISEPVAGAAFKCWPSAPLWAQTLVQELPNTRSGKILRRLLPDVAEGCELGDTSTLVDPSVFEAIRASKWRHTMTTSDHRAELRAGQPVTDARW